jgi:peptidoglycan/LPS O-acetylase OafA/YrhL
MLFHLGYWYGDTAASVAKVAVQFNELAIFRFGRVAPCIFFVLSGFVIAYSAHNSTASAFLRGRVLRLMPAIWIIAPISLGVLFAVGFAPPAELIERFLRSITLFPFGPWVDGVYWTLSVEVMFYGLILALLVLNRFRWVGPLMAVVGGISACFWIARAFGFDMTPHFAAGTPQIGNPNFTDRIMELSLIYYGCFFALGVYLWLSFYQGLTGLQKLYVGVFIIGCYLNIESRGAFILFVAAVLAMILSIRFNDQFGINSRINTTLRILGLTTYPLYLLHDVVGAAIIGRLVQAGISPYPALIISLIIVLGISSSIAMMIEPQVRAHTASCLALISERFRNVWFAINSTVKRPSVPRSQSH